MTQQQTMTEAPRAKRFAATRRLFGEAGSDVPEVKQWMDNAALKVCGAVTGPRCYS